MIATEDHAAAATECGSEQSAIGERSMWCLVIHSALAAAKRGIPEAKQWFETDVFETVAGFLGLDIHWFKEQARSSKPLFKEPRAEYIETAHEKQMRLNPGYSQKRKRKQQREAARTPEAPTQNFTVGWTSDLSKIRPKKVMSCF
jgi:hypothetical protein